MKALFSLWDIRTYRYITSDFQSFFSPQSDTTYGSGLLQDLPIDNFRHDDIPVEVFLQPALPASEQNRQFSLDKSNEKVMQCKQAEIINAMMTKRRSIVG